MNFFSRPHYKRYKTRLYTLKLCFVLLFASFFTIESATAERFKDVEIRVIRPKYFTKRKRLELGAQFTGIMNETFIYTFIASGLATFHFNEYIAIEGALGIAASIDKEDKRLLFDQFEIKTKIFRTKYLQWASLNWTPIYGKWQLSSGHLIYFDTFVSLGFGQTGIDWIYTDFCEQPDADGLAAGTQSPIPGNRTVAYNTILYGLGQRYFLDKKNAFRWDIRGHSIMFDTLDGECDQSSGSSSQDIHQNITISLGMSRFL